MGNTKGKGNPFPHVKGLAKKRTKFGHRWILTEPDSTGKPRSITVKILDSDPLDVFFRKVSDARKELRRKDREKTFDAYLKEYFIINQLSERTILGYKQALNGFSFVDRSNRELVHKLIQSDKKISTIQIYITRINKFFDFAIKHGAPTTNPVLDIKIKSKVPPRSRIATNEELKVIVSYADRREPEYRLFIYLLIHTGARVSSILELSANDLHDGLLQIYNVKSKKYYDYLIPIKNETVLELWECVTKDGVLWHVDPIKHEVRLHSYLYKKFPPDNKGERLSIHSLRHTFASRAVQNGVPIEVVSKLLDHSSASTTLRVYARFSQEQINEAVLKATKKPT